MLIKTKFNGYSIDGVRLYNDPATAAIIASGAGELGTAAAVASAAAAPTLATVAPTLAATNAGILNTIAPEVAKEVGQTALMQGAEQTATGIMSGAPSVTPGAPPVISGAPPVNQINTGITQNAATTPASSTAPTAPSLPNVSTSATPEAAQAYYGDAASQASNELNRQIAAKTAEAQLNPIEKGFSYAKKLAGEATQFTKDNPMLSMMGMMGGQELMKPKPPEKKKYSPYKGTFTVNEPTAAAYTPVYQPTSYYAVGGPVEQMSAGNAIGANSMYPQSQLQTAMYSNPMVQRPQSGNVINPSGDAGVNPYTGEAQFASGGNVSAFEKMMRDEEKRRSQAAENAESMIEKSKSIGGAKPYSRTQSTNSPYAAALKEFQAMGKKYGIPTTAPEKTNVDVMGNVDDIEYAAQGGIMHGLGGYSDGGRLLKGPGDGVSDSIPAVIGNRQPARLADGEFVIPARIVSELGNGSTEAGARQLYAMMERIQKGRKKSIGKDKVAVNSKANKHLPK